MTLQDIHVVCALFEDLYEVGIVGPNQVAVRLPRVPWWAFSRRVLRSRLKTVLLRYKPATIELIFQERFFQ